MKVGIKVSEKSMKRSPKERQSIEARERSNLSLRGGLKGWQQYLNRNLRYPREAILRQGYRERCGWHL